MGRLPDGVLPHSSPALAALRRRLPIRIEGVVYWVDEDSAGLSKAYTIDGNIVGGLQIDYARRWIVCTEEN